MNKRIKNMGLALVLLVVFLPLRVRAEGRDGIRLDESGTVTVVSQHAAKEEISSLGFGLSVDSDNASRVEFRFEGINTEILEYRYDEAAGKLNIYMAGTKALFTSETEPLTIGRIIVLDESGRETTARVSVVENSLQYVYGTEQKIMQETDLPGTVQIGSAGATPPPAVTQPPAEPQEPEDDQDEEEPQVPEVTQTPSGGATRPPQTPRATPKPQPTKVPAPQATKTPAPQTPSPPAPQVTKTPAPAQSTGNPPDGSGGGSQITDSTPQPSADVPGTDKDAEGGSRVPEEKTESQGINAVIVVAVTAIIFVIIMIAAALVMFKKKPKSGR